MKNLAFSARKFSQWPNTIFLNDTFSLNFPISRENRNLEPMTILYDVGHPEHAIRYDVGHPVHALQTVLHLNKKKSFYFISLMYNFTTWHVHVFRIGYCIHYTGKKVG